MTPRERAAYHERMRIEYDRQEQERLDRLRQIEEDAWVAEQLSRLSVATDDWYPDDERRELGEYYEGLTGKRWDWRIPTETAMTEPAQVKPETVVNAVERDNALRRDESDPAEQLYAHHNEAPSSLRDDRDERMEALERQLESMTRAMEQLLAVRSTPQVIASPVVPEVGIPQEVVAAPRSIDNNEDNTYIETAPQPESARPP
ncbi:hypothetical protein FOMPIDRAFT_102104 [Fomitopsis schrenkii]|uniref:Uncharacterized protein n=1 Tax=Fomitopsis schrenkii TaxID=2126942 RepID=S8DIT0_FOMSC|nr:hypothetical protein FOMPIDRAFT_102104 [Fomitopsis schrenkii]